MMLCAVFKTLTEKIELLKFEPSVAEVREFLMTKVQTSTLTLSYE